MVRIRSRPRVHRLQQTLAMLHYLISIWPLATLAAIALPMADDLLRSRHRGGSHAGRGQTCFVSLATSRITRHRWLWITVLGTQFVNAAVGYAFIALDTERVDTPTFFVVTSGMFSELAALLFLISPFLAALYWLRLKFAHDARADVLAISLWYAPTVLLSSSMLIFAAMDSDATGATFAVVFAQGISLPNLPVEGISLILGLSALLVGLRSVRRNPNSTRTGQRTWLMLGLMLPHVSLAWMHLEIPLTHAFVSVLAFGWAHSVWLRESRRVARVGGDPRLRGAFVTAATGALALLVVASLLRRLFLPQAMDEGTHLVTLFGLDPASQMVVASLIGAIALAVSVVAGSGAAFRPFLAAATWSGIWALWMGQNGMGWSADANSIHAATWLFATASTLLLAWTIRVVFAPSSNRSEHSRSVESTVRGELRI